MNPDDFLHRSLSGLAVPEPDPAACDRALHHATIALRAARPARPAADRRWMLAAGVAAIILLLALGATLGLRRPDGERLPGLTAERALLSQMEGLFGSQLDAVVERPDSGADIRLSTAAAADATRPSLAQPVLIQFQRASGAATRVLSYSGRAVCVTLGERRVCFEPLVTGRDEVLLLGDTFCLPPGKLSGRLNGYQVTARLLPRS